MKQDMSEDILIKYILGEASPGERQEIETWKAASSVNAKKFEQVKIILEASKRLAKVSPLAETKAWEKFKEIRSAGRTPAEVRPMYRNANWLRVAAAILFLTGGGWIVYSLYHQGSNSDELISLKTANTVRVTTLPDGSVVHLNKNSSITYTGNFKAAREIRLTGEAFFDIKHNEQAPFTVRVNDVMVKDIGTAFNIKSKQHRTEVIVESGIVSVSRSSNSVRLTPNQMVRIKPGDRQFKIEKTTDVLYNYYRSNKFIASGTPLWRLIDILNDAYNAGIKIENNSLRNMPITVTIRYQDSLSNILEVIKSTTPEIHVNKTSRGFIIK